MRRVLGWMAVFLCCAAEAGGPDAGTDARLVEAQAAFDQAQRLLEEGRYGEALPYADHALALREAVLGARHPDVAQCLNLVGELYQYNGDYVRAEEPLQRGLAIREDVFGKDHPDVASSLANLADLYCEQGLYSQAELLSRRALAIREAALGENHPDVSDVLVTIAYIYRFQGLLDRSEQYFQRALAILEAALGDSHPRTAVPLTSLAVLYVDMGLFDRAEPLLQRALHIQEAAHNVQQVAALLYTLGFLYGYQGSYSRAELLLQRALTIDEAAFGQNHRFTVRQLIGLGGVYLEQGLYKRAEPPLTRALAITEGASLADHKLLIDTLLSLARVYTGRGLYNKAEQYFQRSLALLEHEPGNRKVLPIAHYWLASLYSAQGLYDRAEPLYQRALAEFDASDNNPYFVVRLLGDFAQLRVAQHRLADALPLFTRALTLSEQRLRREALDFSESRLASFLQFLRSDEERLYALLRTHPRNAGVRRLALTAALLLKGRSAEEIANTSRAIYRGLGAQDRDTFERLRGLRTQLAQLSVDGPGPLLPADYHQRLKALADQGDALEAELAKRSAPLRALAALPAPAEIVGRVAAALPKDGALVEFVAYEDRPVVPKPGTPASRIPTQLHYQALVLFPDGHTRAADLGPAASIDSAASRLRDALARRDAAYESAAYRLYQLAFQPLQPLLGDVHRLFLAPDGQLSLVPFAALHDGHRFLVDAYDFTYLTSGKDLLPRLEDIPTARSVVILADPDFGAPRPPATPDGAAPLAERSYSVERFFSTLRADAVEQPWVPLPGTREEAEALQRLLPQAQLFLGPEASKERLLHLETPGILHIATHGFFLEDAAVPAGSRAVVPSGPLGGVAPAPHLPDPLLRSGLVLSGARAQVAKAGETPSHRLDDSLVTALELAGLNLWGTELVVLSACDTGRGDVKLGQGVYGLRRALVVAGAETVVMSLWKVNDETTRTLMEAYYRGLLAGKGRVAALREAMLALRVQRPHPHFWAPFIALGRDAPLRGLAPPAP